MCSSSNVSEGKFVQFSQVNEPHANEYSTEADKIMSKYEENKLICVLTELSYSKPGRVMVSLLIPLMDLKSGGLRNFSSKKGKWEDNRVCYAKFLR